MTVGCWHEDLVWGLNGRQRLDARDGCLSVPRSWRWVGRNIAFRLGAQGKLWRLYLPLAHLRLAVLLSWPGCPLWGLHFYNAVSI